jgi:hypothetical protein
MSANWSNNNDDTMGFLDDDLAFLNDIRMASPMPSMFNIPSPSSSDEHEPLPKKQRITIIPQPYSLTCDANLIPIALDGPILDMSHFDTVIGPDFDFNDLSPINHSDQLSNDDIYPINNNSFKVIQVAQAVTFNACIQFVNDEFLELFRAKDAACVIGKNIMEFVPPAFQQWVCHNLQSKLQQSGSGNSDVQFPTILARLDGTCFIAVLQFSLFQDIRQGFQQATFSIDFSSVRPLNIPAFPQQQ